MSELLPVTLSFRLNRRDIGLGGIGFHGDWRGLS
jgi:hypothetical protein